MGTCYSKSGQEIDLNSEKKPKERKRGSQKNGHTGSIKNPRLVIDIPIQKDLSDTVYTEDSHICITDAANCINKSMQTSLNNLARDANKNIESLTGCEIIEQKDCVVIKDKINTDQVDGTEDCVTENAQELQKDHLKHLELTDGKVSTSDSGIVVEGCKSCDVVEQHECVADDYSENFETRLDSLHDEETECGCKTMKTETAAHTQCSCNHSGSIDNDSQRPVFSTEHSISCSCNEVDNRESVASIDRLSESYRSTDSPTDLDKIRLAIRQSSLGSPTDNRSSIFDGSDTSYELSSAVTQPEVAMMTMNGREVVVIDAELFSQIIDEIQNLKMRLSQLTEVIQDADEENSEQKSAAVSILSSSA